ncbi:hypothetical protein BH11BAC4_BH11BAC4_06710 [soil metagenome]
MQIPASLRICFSGIDITTDVLGMLFPAAVFFTGFSRENLEDEVVTQYRLIALLRSVYINYAFVLAGFIFLDAVAFPTRLVYNLFSTVFVHIVIFYFIIFRNSDMASK